MDATVINGKVAFSQLRVRAGYGTTKYPSLSPYITSKVRITGKGAIFTIPTAPVTKVKGLSPFISVSGKAIPTARAPRSSAQRGGYYHSLVRSVRSNSRGTTSNAVAPFLRITGPDGKPTAVIRAGAKVESVSPHHTTKGKIESGKKGAGVVSRPPFHSVLSPVKSAKDAVSVTPKPYHTAAKRAADKKGQAKETPNKPHADIKDPKETHGSHGIIGSYNPISRYKVGEGNRGKIHGETSETPVGVVTTFNNLGIVNATIDLQEKTRGYVFFTAMDMNLISGDANLAKVVPIVGELDHRILEQLSLGEAAPARFIPVLTNQMEGFEPSDVVVKTQETHETTIGYKRIAPTSYVESVTGGTFQVEFTDIHGGEITKLFKAWVDYIFAIRRGYIRPKPSNVTDKIVDYLGSMYYFVVGPDGKEIVYWSKLTGVAPTAVPYSAYGTKRDQHSEIVKFSVPFVFSYKEDMDPNILADFNLVAGGLVEQEQKTPIRFDMKSLYEVGFEKIKGAFNFAASLLQQTQVVDNKGKTVSKSDIKKQLPKETAAFSDLSNNKRVRVEIRKPHGPHHGHGGEKYVLTFYDPV
jgi:hypothetical protein